MAKMSKSYETIIKKNVWGVDDTYLTADLIQVFELDGFKEGQKVKVTVTVSSLDE